MTDQDELRTAYAERDRAIRDLWEIGKLMGIDPAIRDRGGRPLKLVILEQIEILRAALRAANCNPRTGKQWLHKRQHKRGNLESLREAEIRIAQRKADIRRSQEAAKEWKGKA